MEANINKAKREANRLVNQSGLQAILSLSSELSVSLSFVKININLFPQKWSYYLKSTNTTTLLHSIHPRAKSEKETISSIFYLGKMTLKEHNTTLYCTISSKVASTISSK